jgi:hypothetical protein
VETRQNVFLSFAIQLEGEVSFAGACLDGKAPGDLRDDIDVEAVLAADAGE